MGAKRLLTTFTGVSPGLFTSLFFAFQPEGSNLTPEDPQWIGAWWLGYLAGGCFLVLIAGLVLGYPRELPGTKRMRREAQKEGHIPKKDERIRGNMKDILPATLQLLKAPVLIFNTFAITAGSLFGAGIASFMPKILQLKYGLSSFLTGVIIGTIVVPGTLGTIFLKLNFSQIMRDLWYWLKVFFLYLLFQVSSY